VGLVLLAGCRSSSTPDAALGKTPSAADAGSSLVVDLAVPLRHTMLKRARCTLPDGGARVSVFDAHRVSEADCEVFPLACGTVEARAEVLRRLDAGTLVFPTPHFTTRTDALGWFEAPLEDDGLVVVECAGEATIFHAPSGLDRSFTDPTVELSEELPGGDGTIEGRVLVINPWTRRTEVVEPAKWAGLSPRLIGHAWATTLEGPALMKAPSKSLLSAGGNGWGTMFGGPPIPPPPPPENAVKVTVRVAMRGGLVRRPTSLQVMGMDGGQTGWITTRTPEHVFLVEPGRSLVQVNMPGARSAEVPVEVSGPTSVTVTLEPGVATMGLVVDAQGKPVSGAVVEVDGVVTTDTDVSGAFTVAEEGPRRLRARHPGVGSSEELAVADAGPVTLVLKPRSEVRVRVEAPDGGAVSGIARVLRDGVSEELTRTAAFDPVLIREGRLPLLGLSPGRHQVLLLTGDFAAARLEFAVGPQPSELVHRLEEKPVIEGVVTRNGQPVVGARVKFERPEAVFSYQEDVTRTDERGAFRLARSLPGEAKLRFDANPVQSCTVPSTGRRFVLPSR